MKRLRGFCRPWLWLHCLLIVSWLASAAQGQDAPTPLDRALAMARRVDARLAERLMQEGVTPAPDATDAEFQRRVFLDLTGVIPSVAQVREFAADQRTDKRSRLIEQLLASPAHATHLASVWRGIMLPNGFEAEQLNNAVGLENWLREQFVRNMRYDRIVADFLVSGGGDEIGPALFYTSQDLAPEKLAASTSRIFLGLQIDCAQCHDHKFDRWTQKDFWAYAAFFARLQQSPAMQAGMTNTTRLVDIDAGEVKLPETDEVIAPAYPGAAAPADESLGTRRQQLAVWMASRDNPYLAKAAVNRVWSQLFGRGLVEPVDDLSPNNPPSHPELLTELAEEFARSGFDLRQLYRTLANTRAYQLSSQTEAGAADRPELFARMAIKPLTAEQLYDSLNQSLGRKLSSSNPGLRASNRLFDPQRLAFIGKMAASGRSPTDFRAGLPQALTLMNGIEMAAVTNPEQGGLLASLEAPFFTDADRIETLFLATLSRPPADAERSTFTEYLADRGNDEAKRRAAFGDVLWALLNSSEFALNH